MGIILIRKMLGRIARRIDRRAAARAHLTRREVAQRCESLPLSQLSGLFHFNSGILVSVAKALWHKVMPAYSPGARVIGINASGCGNCREPTAAVVYDLPSMFECLDAEF